MLLLVWCVRACVPAYAQEFIPKSIETFHPWTLGDVGMSYEILTNAHTRQMSFAFKIHLNIIFYDESMRFERNHFTKFTSNMTAFDGFRSALH